MRRAVKHRCAIGEYFHKLFEAPEPIYNGIEGRKRLDDARRKLKNPNLQGGAYRIRQFCG